MTRADAPPSIFNRQVVTLLSAGVAYFVVAGISFPLLPRLVERRVGGDDTDIGLTFGMMALGMLVMRPAIGYLADRYGRRPMMVGGAIGVGLLQLVHVPAADVGLWMLLVVRFLLRMASSAMYLGQATTATEIEPKERSAEIFSIFGVAVFVGFASFTDPNIKFIGVEQTIHDIEIYIGVLIGAVTFSGSVIAGPGAANELRATTARKAV